MHLTCRRTRKSLKWLRYRIYIAGQFTEAVSLEVSQILTMIRYGRSSSVSLELRLESMQMHLFD